MWNWNPQNSGQNWVPNSIEVWNWNPEVPSFFLHKSKEPPNCGPVVWLKDDGLLAVLSDYKTNKRCVCVCVCVCVFGGDGFLSFDSVVLMKESLATLNLLSNHYHVLSRCG